MSYYHVILVAVPVMNEKLEVDEITNLYTKLEPLF